MLPSFKCYTIIKWFEEVNLRAYEETPGIWRIGYGTTFYPGGGKVRQGDHITQSEADLYLEMQVRHIFYSKF